MNQKTRPEILRCTCCGKQPVKGRYVTDYVTWLEHAVADIGGVICGLCAADLDDQGLFPNEPGYNVDRRRGNTYGK